MLSELLARYSQDQIFVLADKNTVKLLPLYGVEKYPCVCLPAGESAKCLDSVAAIWDFLIDGCATRKALLINVGGGVITDLGGFAASTYKRGIDYVNVPTSLLAMVDAATGGKTGFDYRGLKNVIGLFRAPVEVMLDARALRTLPMIETMSGLAEMVKHALIADEQEFLRLMAIDVESDFTSSEFEQHIRASVAIKQAIVAQDPMEKGLRKCLNFGHTIGHAIESLSLEQGTNLRHGYAVMYGMLAEMYLSHIICGLDVRYVTLLSHYIIENYGRINVSCRHYDRLVDLMRHDKKNACPETINFTLLREVAQPVLDCTATDAQIREALDFLFSV